MSRALIIYDQNGQVWNITYGESTLPMGLKAFSAEVPDGSQVGGIDLSDPMAPKVTYQYLPETDIDRLQKQMAEVISTSAEMTNKVNTISEQINPTIDLDICSLQELKTWQKNQIGERCTNAIERGVIVKLTDETEHTFSYTRDDQLNYTELKDCISDGFPYVPYHADGQDCVLYSADDMKLIVLAQRKNKTILLTKCNQLNRMIDACEDKESVQAINWKTELTGEYLEKFNTIKTALESVEFVEYRSALEIVEEEPEEILPEIQTPEIDETVEETTEETVETPKETIETEII